MNITAVTMNITAMRNARGSAVVELTIVTPAIVLVMLLVVLAGRVTLASSDVAAAASDAARAASIRQSGSAARVDAQRTAARSLADRGVTCRGLDVRTDTSRLRPAGHVAVRVSCTVHLADLAPLGIPASRTITATASEVVDRFRSR